MSATKNINAEKIQGNLDVNGLSATTVNVNGNYSLPNTVGTDGQVLTINGSGGVEWSSVTKTTLNVNVSLGTNDQVPFMKSTNNDFEYSSELTFNSSKLRVTNVSFPDRYVDIFDDGYMELKRESRGIRIRPFSSYNQILTNLFNTDLSIYSNNDKQLYLKYDNPYIGINENDPEANLHIKPTLAGQRSFLVQNASGDNLFEITTDGKVKISDSYTLPNNAPGTGNVIVADGMGGSSWELFPLDPRWTSSTPIPYNSAFTKGRISANEFRVIDLNISADTNPNIIHTTGSQGIIQPILTLGSDNNFGNNTSTVHGPALYHMLTIGTGNTSGQYGANKGVVIGDNNNISSFSGWPTTINSETNFRYRTTGYPSGVYTTGLNAHGTAQYFISGDNNYASGEYIFSTGSDNLLFGYNLRAVGSGITGFTAPGDGFIYNVGNASVLGDNIHAFWSNQILVGRGFSTENTNNRPGLYFGWSTTGTTKPSMGLVGSEGTSQNFAMGGVDVFTSGATTSIFQEGVGSGNFFLYRDSSTVEPYDIIPNAVALFAKQSPRGVTGLAVKAEDDTYSMFTDTVSIGLTGGTAMLEVKSKGDDNTTDMLKVKNSNGDVGIQITDGLNVYMPNLPITPGGLSSGGLYIDTSTNTIKVV